MLLSSSRILYPKIHVVPADTAPLAVLPLSAELSTFPIFWPILNIHTVSKMSRKSEQFSEYQSLRAVICSASLVFIT